MAGLFNDPGPPRPAATTGTARGPNPEWPSTTRPTKPATIASEALLGATEGGLTPTTQSTGMLKPLKSANKTLGWG